MSAILEYPQKHPISAEEYLRMGEAGVFAPEARLELIEGDLVEMAAVHPPHAGLVRRLSRLFHQQAGSQALVSVQAPLVISERSVPQPDLALLVPRADDYMTSHPNASDVLLVVEVPDSTLDHDLRVKVPLYARCGIVEAWVVDVANAAVHVFRHPAAHGYRTSVTARGGALRKVGVVASIAIPVAELFG